MTIPEIACYYRIKYYDLTVSALCKKLPWLIYDGRMLYARENGLTGDEAKQVEPAKIGKYLLTGYDYNDAIDISLITGLLKGA
jgi:hypothetical protein